MAIMICSVLLSIVLVLLWNGAPRLYLLGEELSGWKHKITPALKAIGYTVTDSGPSNVHFYKKRGVFSGTQLLILQDNAKLYAFVWKGAGHLKYNFTFFGKSEARKIRELIYNNNESPHEPRFEVYQRLDPIDKTVNLRMELLHADNHVEAFNVSEEEAIKRALSFSWDSELSQAELRKECSPTVSLEYPQKTHILWASVIGQPDEFEFLVCLQCKKALNSSKQLSDGQEKETVVAQADEISISKLPELFHLFYAGEFETLAEKIEKR